MFSYQLPAPRRPFASALQATMLHASLIAGAVVATRTVAPELHEQGPTYVDLPLARPLTTPRTSDPALDAVRAQPVVFSIAVPTLPPIDPGLTLIHDPLPVDPLSLIPGGADSSTGSDLTADSASVTTIISESEVDEPPTLLSAGMLRYPAVLDAVRVEGKVTLRFIIDAEGRVEPDGITVISATDAGFVPAAREAVLTSRFRPAMKVHRPVRVRVQQTITFKH